MDIFASQDNAKCPLFCSRAGSGRGSLGDAFLVPWGPGLLYLFPPLPLLQQAIRREQLEAILIAPRWPRQPWFTTLSRIVGGVLGPTDDPAPTLPTGRESVASGSALPSPDGVEDHLDIDEVLRNALKPSTRALYAYKWKLFRSFAERHDFAYSPVSIPGLLRFLLYLFRRNLSHSTLRVYVAAVAAHQPSGAVAGSLFKHDVIKRFLTGLKNIRPSAAPLPPQWSLQLVLHCLARPPFEPMASSSEEHLTLKTVFLVAITSARRASELAALRAGPPYIQFHPDKVTLYTDVSFVPKVASAFHQRQPIILPSFFPRPTSPLERRLHMLDVRRALSFYVDRTAKFRRDGRLFVCPHLPRRGLAASSQTISKWIRKTITLAYELSDTPLPLLIRPHSTRTMAASTAFLRGVSVPDICKAATWASQLTFAVHYRLDVRAKQDASFGRAVLLSLLH